MLTATVTTGSTGNSLTGTVSFFSGTTAIGSPVAVSAGRGTGNTANATALLSTTQLTAGADSITAQYSGDGNYNGSTSAATTINVITQTSTTVRSSNGTIQQGSSVTFTATITPGQSGGPAMTGTVQFAENGTNFGSAGTVNLVCDNLSVRGAPWSPTEVNILLSGPDFKPPCTVQLDAAYSPSVAGVLNASNTVSVAVP